MAEERVWAKHEDGRTATFGRKAFKLVWSKKGWTETDPPSDDELVAAQVEGTSPAGGDEDRPLEDLTVAELRDRADTAGIDVPARATKGELLDALAEEGED